MALSDYNYLRQMLGYSKVTLGEDEFILQIKARIYNETGDFTDEIVVFDQGEKLTCKEVRTEPFSQDGHNGGDYILVVPDERNQRDDMHIIPNWRWLSVEKYLPICRANWMI